MRPQLLGVEEFSESLFQVIRIGSHISSTGELKVNPVHFLESVLEHGAIDLSEKLAIDAIGGLWVDAEAEGPEKATTANPATAAAVPVGPDRGRIRLMELMETP